MVGTPPRGDGGSRSCGHRGRQGRFGAGGVPEAGGCMRACWSCTMPSASTKLRQASYDTLLGLPEHLISGDYRWASWSSRPDRRLAMPWLAWPSRASWRGRSSGGAADLTAARGGDFDLNIAQLQRGDDAWSRGGNACIAWPSWARITICEVALLASRVVSLLWGVRRPMLPASARVAGLQDLSVVGGWGAAGQA